MAEILIAALLGGYLCFFLLAVLPGLLLQRLRAVRKVLRMTREFRGQWVLVYLTRREDQPLPDRRLYGPCRASVATWLMLEMACRYPDADLLVLPISGDHLFHCLEPTPDAWRFLGWRVPGRRVHYRVR